MSLSLRHMVSEVLGLSDPVVFRRDLFRQVASSQGSMSVRSELENFTGKYAGFKLKPKWIPRHPRLAPISCIHFDHYNSSVTNLPAPDRESQLKVKFHQKQGGLSQITGTGTCLNFLVDNEGHVYGFCGNGAIKVKFKVTSFDDSFRKTDEFQIAQFPCSELKGDDLPLNLGYFIMDNDGRIIVIKDKAEVLFIKINGDGQLNAVHSWRNFRNEIEKKLDGKIEDYKVSQIIPTYHKGYWVMAIGDKEKKTSAFLAMVSEDGTLTGFHQFGEESNKKPQRHEVIENGMAIDDSGAYVVTDYCFYKFKCYASGEIQVDWETPYTRSTDAVKIKKKKTLSKYGSGSTPTLFGKQDDLVAFTDNADDQIHLVVLDRSSGNELVKIPLFKEGQSANENTVLAYGDSVVVQNWYSAPDFRDDMKGLTPGLMRFDILDDRKGYERTWYNETFASTATVRLSTKTGLIYGTIRKKGRRETYAMVFIDFHTGQKVREVKLGTGKKFRINMSPSYIIPGGKLIQPVMKGFCVLEAQE